MGESEQQPGRNTEQGPPHKKIAEQIFNLEGDPTENIIKLLEALAQRDRQPLLMALRLYFRAKGDYTTDLCFMGISDRFVQNVFEPADFVLYTYIQKLRPNDMAVVSRKEGGVRNDLSFRRVSEVLPDNKIQVQSDSGIGRIITREDIVAKVARVVKFGTKEWKEIANEIAFKIKLQQVLIDAKNANGITKDQLREIDKRLAFLK